MISIIVMYKRPFYRRNIQFLYFFRN